MLDQLLQPFVRTMQRGAEMQVLLDDGKVLSVEASFDAELTRLILGVKQVTREIYLADIERVSGPTEEESCMTNRKHINECCTTLVLSSTHFLTFSFESKRQREYFEVCLRTILASQHAVARDGKARQVRTGEADTLGRTSVEGI